MTKRPPSDPTPSIAPPKWERYARRAIFAFVSLWLLLCTQQDHMSVNPASRYAGMEALVEHGTYAIDETSLLRSTVDKVQWEGQFYSSKPPLLYTLAAPAYLAVTKITGETFRSARYPTARRMRVVVALLPWLIGLWIWGRLVDHIAADPVTRTWAFGAMALGGLPTAYASHLDNHSLAVLALLAMALAAAPLVRDDAPWAPSAAALGGIAGGLAVTMDLGAGPIVGAIGLWVVARAGARREWTSAAAYVLGGLVAPAAQVAIQVHIAGTWRPFYLLDSAYQYAGSYWSRPVEFDALAEPKSEYAFHALLGHHGLFSHTPWLLLGLPWFVTRERSRWLDALRVAAAAGALFVVGYYISRTVNYGGRCVGMRWFMVVHVPLALAAVRHASRTGWVARNPATAGLLVGWAAISALGGAINPWEEGFVYALFRALGAGSIAG